MTEMEISKGGRDLGVAVKVQHEGCGDRNVLHPGYDIVP